MSVVVKINQDAFRRGVNEALTLRPLRDAAIALVKECQSGKGAGAREAGKAAEGKVKSGGYSLAKNTKK